MRQYNTCSDLIKTAKKNQNTISRYNQFHNKQI